MFVSENMGSSERNTTKVFLSAVVKSMLSQCAEFCTCISRGQIDSCSLSGFRKSFVY